MTTITEKTIELEAVKYTYTLRHPARSRQLRVSVRAGGVLTVSAPRWVVNGIIEQFLRDRAPWIIQHVKRLKESGPQLLSRGGQREYKQHKEAALQLVLERLAHFNQHYGFPFERVSIRNQKTRWGSCSRHGNLSFNYRIALLPPELADYVILHELCHLQAFDHSDRFWRLMERAMPDYAKRRQQIRKIA